MKKLIVFMLVVVMSTGMLLAQGQSEGGLNYPNRPIKLIVPWAPGGSSDALARVLASVAPEYLGVDVEVVNRDGAGGTIATSEVKAAKPDGYTIQLNAVGVMTTQPAMREVPYTIDDFDYVIGLSYEPIVMLSHTNSKYKTFNDFKNAKGTVMMAANAPGSLPYIAAIDVMNQAGIEAEAVPMTGGGPSLTALLGNHVDLAMVHPNEALQHVNNGDLQFLGICSLERNKMFPDVPTFKEMGIVVDYSVWKWIQVPAGVDPAIRDILESKFKEMLNDPKVVEFAKNSQLEMLDMPGGEIREVLKSQASATAKVIDMIGL